MAQSTIDGGPSHRAASSRRSRGRLFWAEGPDGHHLEPRTLLSLTFTEFPLPMVEIVQPQGITTGPDGNLWFTENGADRIGRITPAGALTEFPLPEGLIDPGEIASGPDGNLWFTAWQESDNMGVVGRVTPIGGVTAFVLPTSGYILDITTGPDGNLWYTQVGSSVGQMTPQGVVTEFTMPEVPPAPDSPSGSPNRQPQPKAITAGPDGALWFTSDTSQVWRLSPDGVFTPFEVAGLSASQFDDITSGADGALWFTGLDGKVGRITTTGAVTEIATAGFSPGDTIITGSDGSLWFNEPEAPRIAKLTPSGAMTSFTLPGSFYFVGGLAPGPDGQVWFTEWDDEYTPGDQAAVGKISPAGVSTLYPIVETTFDPDHGIAKEPSEITLGPDGALWFVEVQSSLGTGQIGRMTLDGALQEFPLDSTPKDITSGRDGALWFTQSTEDEDFNTIWSIGRITTGGVITNFRLPENLTPDDLVWGADGNLWFTADTETSAVLGRMTPRGVVKTFDVPFPKKGEEEGGAGTVSAITVGPDRNVWFTGFAYGNDKKPHQWIGRATRQGHIQLFAVPYKPGLYEIYGPPGAIVTGPDGALWFASDSHGIMLSRYSSIGRITTSGVFGPRIPSDELSGFGEFLVPGSRGQAWFVTDDSIARATRSGVIVAQDIPELYMTYPAWGIAGITAAPDGNLWITDGVSKIVRISDLDTPSGALDWRVKAQFAKTLYSGTSAQIVRVQRPGFAGTAKPGSVVTLWARRQGETKLTAIGRAHANRCDGSWTLTSKVRLADGAYEILATQKGDTRPPSVLYSLETEAYGDMPHALIVAASPAHSAASRRTATAVSQRTATAANRSAVVPNANLARSLAVSRSPGSTTAPNNRSASPALSTPTDANPRISILIDPAAAVVARISRVSRPRRPDAPP